MPQKKITIEVNAASVIEEKAIETVCKKLAAQPAAVRSRISELLGNQKALNSLMKNWELLKTMI